MKSDDKIVKAVHGDTYWPCGHIMCRGQTARKNIMGNLAVLVVFRIPRYQQRRRTKA